MQVDALLGQGLWSGDSGDSSRGGAAQAAVAAASEPGSEGVLSFDSETHVVSMPPVPLVVAYQFMKDASSGLEWVPLLNHLIDAWQTQELTDASTYLWHDVLLQPDVSLRELLEIIDVAVHEMSFCVPKGKFSGWDVSSQPTQSAELQSMVNNTDAKWVF